MTDSKILPMPEELLASLVGEEDVSALSQRLVGVGDSSSVATLLEQASDLLYRTAMRDVAQATRSSRLLIELADRTGAGAARISTRLTCGIAQTYANAFDAALATLGEAESIRPVDGPDRQRAEVALARVGLARVHVLARLGRLEEAAEVGEAAVAALVTLGSTEFAARGHANLGVIERMRQRPKAAIERFQAALAAWGADPVGRAQLTSNLAEAYLDLDRFAEAESAFRDALAALEAAQVTHAAAIVEGNLADLLGRQGRLSEALEHYERVRRRYLSIDARGDAARLQAEEANAFAQTGLLGEAVAEYRAALEELDRCGLRPEAVRARLGLARALGRLGRFDDAARALEAISLDGDRPDVPAGSPLEGTLRTARGELALARGSADAAVAELRAAVPLLASRPTDQAVARTRLAQAAISCGDVAQARPLIDESLTVAKEYLLRPLEAELLHAAARCAAAEGDETRQMQALRNSVELVEGVRGTLQASRLRSAFVAENSSAAADLLHALVRRGDQDSLIEALHVAECVRGRALLDALAGAVPATARRGTWEGESGAGSTDGQDDVLADLLREAEAARQEANALFSRLERKPDAAMSDEWREAVLAVESRQRLIESRMGARERLRSNASARLSQADVAGLVASETAHVVTCVAGSRVIVLASRAGHLQAADVGDVHAIAEGVERFRFQVHRSLLATGERAKRIEADLRGELSAISARVLSPFAELLQAAPAVQVIPAGPLHAVPFGLLPLGGDPLVIAAPVASAPSISVSIALGAIPDRSAAALRRVVVGVADEAAPSIATEARTIASRDPQASLLTGADATAEAVRQAARSADVLHCASHGRFVAESPLRSGVLLGDGWLTVKDLYRWRLPGTIVVVSGCDTGRVAVEGGDELVGLQQGFFAAGASAVVLSAWLAHDGATLDLMLDFHQRLGTRAGTADSDAAFGVSRALRSAMLEVRRDRPRMVEWGTFSLLGRVLG
jgi:CHAT domain-containing protein